jgi:hypothetical protein
MMHWLLQGDRKLRMLMQQMVVVPDVLHRRLMRNHQHNLQDVDV